MADTAEYKPTIAKFLASAPTVISASIAAVKTAKSTIEAAEKKKQKYNTKYNAWL